MMRADIQIDGSARVDTRTAFGLIYLTSDKFLAAPARDYEATSYAEESGEHIDPRTVETAFDCKFTFITEYLRPQLDQGARINSRIAQLNNAMFAKEPGSDILRARRITIYDITKHRKIVGYPRRVSEPKEEDVFYSKNQEFAVIELNLRVSDPKLCDFDFHD